ncbi:Speckle-type POZ protein-like protein [Aphelenchoides bicaudatus]|nr:Speckle-type POZ protein-like protein [Aphelenchoides bicaudatus]
MSDDLFEADSYTITRLPCDSYSILWTVEDFARFLNADFPLVESSSFQPLGPGTLSFSLVLSHKEGAGKFSIALKLVERMDATPIHVTARLLLLDKGDEKHYKSEEFMPKINDETEDDSVLATFTIEQSNEEKTTYLRSNEAGIVRCELGMCSDPLNYPVTSKTSGYMHYSQLIDDLHRIYEDHEFSDGVIEVEGKEFFISRAVLAARSAVFRTMFTNTNFTEAQNGRVKIDDFSASIVQKLLDYIYTGRMGNMTEEDAFDLLTAGHKYCIEGVQTLAQEELVRHIDEENVCSLLVHADLYEAELLKQQCIAYIAQHRSQIIKTDGWKQLTDPANHHLMIELIESTKDLQL